MKVQSPILVNQRGIAQQHMDWIAYQRKGNSMQEENDTQPCANTLPLSQSRWARRCSAADESAIGFFLSRLVFAKVHSGAIGKSPVG